MPDFISSDIIAFLQQYGYWAAAIVIILSGPIGAISSGFLAGIHVFNPVYVWLLALGVDIGTDIFYYEVGRRGGRRLFEKLQNFFHWPSKLIEKVEWLFHKHGRKTVVMVKFMQGLGLTAQVMAGIARMPRRYFITANLLAGAVKASILIYIGMLAGATWNIWAKAIASGAWLVTGLILLILLAIFTFYAFQKYVAKLEAENNKTS
ncbi:MAG: hypothetical protein A3J48_02495 [Candidatus Doudnabacteria bacterium RIFCSPHIGHO2_02_FULL_46_11]|uniref:DedA family protein n=1 Tax=Candidatus Doudnabacteria bacterium RIFCSPHIGHO2_02_FULL_46_11 TaxID=1817832 RepID=A0A1F5P9C9_9BACT|nr:MAG: hypothetical protein A3J48_02495 [Candidatus Doudnabacteria bacterium RIFCSPHIGHO2_02_FULL_46_11]